MAETALHSMIMVFWKETTLLFFDPKYNHPEGF